MMMETQMMEMGAQLTASLKRKVGLALHLLSVHQHAQLSVVMENELRAMKNVMMVIQIKEMVVTTNAERKQDMNVHILAT